MNETKCFFLPTCISVELIIFSSDTHHCSWIYEFDANWWTITDAVRIIKRFPTCVCVTSTRQSFCFIVWMFLSFLYCELGYFITFFFFSFCCIFRLLFLFCFSFSLVVCVRLSGTVFFSKPLFFEFTQSYRTECTPPTECPPVCIPKLAPPVPQAPPPPPPSH